MKDPFAERLNAQQLSYQVRIGVAGLIIGMSYGLATIIGILGAQRSAAPDFPIPNQIAIALLIGIAIWTALTSLSVGFTSPRDMTPQKLRMGLVWILISFITSTLIPLLVFYTSKDDPFALQWSDPVKLLMLSSLSFGLGGMIIGLIAVLVQAFFWRFLFRMRWGISLVTVLSFFMGMSAGWAAYGWTVFSSQALFSLYISI
jgi:hypothetical protein